MDSGPSPLATDWLASIQRQVWESIGDADKVNSGDGQWLSVEAANTVMRFFRLAADALPGEPFIYKSSAGDLVAEFKAKHGMLTSVVSGSNLMIYPVVDGKLQGENRFDLQTTSAGALQSALRPITLVLCAGDHGEAVGT